jgi:hypothetical protein
VVRAAGVVVLVLLAGIVAWRVLDRSSTYEQALRALPASTLRATYTDWAQTRREAGGGTLTAASPRARVQAFLDRAYDLDLTSGSGISGSTAVLAEQFGFSPLDADWEALGQSRRGQVDVLHLRDGVDMAGIERALRRLGYTPPRAGSGTGGTWVGSPELVSRISGDLTPVQQNLVVLPDDRLVLMSDDASYVSSSASVVTGSASSMLDDAGVASLAGTLEDPAAAVQWSSTFACEDLTMGAADAGEQEVADGLVADAGRISPLEGLVMAQRADRSLTVALHFGSSDQASRNLQPRVDLASGDAPGQGGSFRDRFRVTSGTASGDDVVLALRPVRRDAQVLSDISTGPVLFATC